MAAAAADRVRVVKPGQTYVGRQGFTYGAGASAETVGAARLCMNVLPMPPGARARAHYHDGIETIAFMLEGRCSVHYGARLEQCLIAETGDQVYIPASVPHAPANERRRPHLDRGHSSGSDQDGIVLLPELDAALAARAGG